MYSVRCSGASAFNTGRVSSPGFIAVKTAIQACCGSAAGIPAAAFITGDRVLCRRRPRRWSRPYQSIWPVPQGSFYEPAAVHNGGCSRPQVTSAPAAVEFVAPAGAPTPGCVCRLAGSLPGVRRKRILTGQRSSGVTCARRYVTRLPAILAELCRIVMTVPDRCVPRRAYGDHLACSDQLLVGIGVPWHSGSGPSSARS